MVTRLVLGLINFFIGLAEIILGLRVVSRLFAANPDASFVQWVYSTSNVLMEPFRGIFTAAVIGRYHVLDFAAMFAMIVYGLIGMLFVYLANYMAPRPTTTVVKEK